MAAGHRAKESKALVIGVGGLNGLAVIDVMRGGNRASGSRKQRGRKSCGEKASQRFIL
jgi:hypothetical protein